MTRPPRLDPGTVDQALAAAGSPWVRSGEHLELERRFETFSDAVAFVNEVAALAEEADHHPDIEIHWNEVVLRLWTHTAGGVTQLDLELARRIDALA